MNQNRRKILKALGSGAGALAAQPYLSFPAIAQSRTLKIGIIAPKAGIVGTIGECGLRGTLFAVDRINAAGGIAGRKIVYVRQDDRCEPTAAIAAAKKLIRDVSGHPPADVASITTALIARLRVSAEGQEGLKAFLEKRKPSWIS